MAHLSDIKHRSDDALYARFHGFEYGPDNAILAVMERHDGKPEMVGMDTLYLIHRNYEECKRLPHLTPYRMSLLASEDALVSDVGAHMNDVRIASFPPKRTATCPTQEFIIAAPSFPASIEQQAATVWQKFSGTTLARTLKPNPVHS